MARSQKPPARSREASPTPSIKSKARRRAPEQLSLAPVAELTAPSSLPFSASPSRRLWLCICLPALPLEAMVSTAEAAAVFEEQQGIRKILLANTKARVAGIGPGLSVNAALALVPALQLEERNPLREAQVLKGLAEWSEKFTAFTAIEAPASLLLEIAGSQKLFGGIKPLRERIVRGLVSQGFHVEVAIAPTPLAATWLARAGEKVCIRDSRNLVGKLSPLSIHCLRWPEAIANALQGMGVTTVGEALRLPRQGFAKRFSATRLLELDRALGRMPDPRVSYRAPERFVADFDLNEEESDSALLLNVCQELLMKLERFLLSRQMAMQQIEFVFFHLQARATHLSLGCVQPDRAAQHWFDLLEIKFDRLILTAPVIAIQLRGGEGQRFSAVSGVLPFNKRERQQRNTSITHLAERLSARIGDEAVHGVMTVAEHRPQYAWQRQNVFDGVPHCANTPAHPHYCHAPELLTEIQRTNSLVLQRPLWMLQKPEPLVTEQDMPCYQGILKLLDGPERLETGWWDDDSIARDYFVACNPRGVHLWVYRDRNRGRTSWYLHGKFG
jgi:protein ImuB